ncbi:MAG TPA: TolC family protein, partial [Candidatus Acidoferrales bacterium]|nr:TolC family protein [Candidatus Acidoferrales bacterium]
LRFSALLAALLGAVALAFGQSSQSAIRITLDEAVQLALAHNHALLAARTTISQSQAQEITANLRPNPVFGADVVGLPVESADFTADNINQAEFDIGLGYLFERGRKRQHRLKAAQDQTAVTKSTVADNERMLTFNVATQFTEVLLAESTLNFAQQDLKDFQNTVSISESQYKAGAISEGDFLKMKLQLLQFQTDVTAAQLAKEQALVALRQLVGYQSVPQDYDVAGDLKYEKLPYTLEDLQARALKDRPDLRAAQQGVTAALSQYSLAKANGKVDVNGTFNFTHITGYNSQSLIVSIPVPIFNRNQGEIARTNYAIEQARQTEQAASEQVMADVQTAYETVHTNEQTLQIYQTGYLDEAKQSVDISEYAYKRGAASLLDFLDAERSYRNTELAYRQQLASYMLALEQLREAVGTRTLP